MQPARDLLPYGEVLQAAFSGGGPPSPWHEAMSRQLRAAGAHQLGAWLDGRLVAVAALHARFGVAHITAVATVQDYRRRGIAAALTAYAVRLGRSEGARFAALEVATEEAERVYSRLGFRRAAGRLEFAEA
jgi:predicted GNAT family acetyltransferase